ncbi:hypothetical protein Ancab_014184 [Ancistrocladus abbreviatus]
MAGYLLFKVHGLCLILFLITTSIHVSRGRVLDGSVLRNNVALPREDLGIRLENLESENSGDDSSRLVKEHRVFDVVEKNRVLLSKYGKLVLHVLPKGTKLPPSGPGKRHNGFNN